MDERSLVWHGVCDLFRIPKFSFYWHQSELTRDPMAYVVRIDSTHVAVFSNCEQVRLWQDTGKGYEQVATQAPDRAYRGRDGGVTREPAKAGTLIGEPAKAGTLTGEPAKAGILTGEPAKAGTLTGEPAKARTLTGEPAKAGTLTRGTADGQEIPYSLRHPPFHFTVSPLAMGLKAEGLIGGTVKSVREWKAPLSPVALTLEADRRVITADGADLSRIIATAIDTNGTPVDTWTLPVTFDIEGLGQRVGENPVKLRAGKMIILAQSAFVPGELTITATAPGLRSAKVTLKTEPVPPNVDMPKNLPAQRPTARRLPSGS